MKFLKSLFCLIPYALFNAKNAFAYDDFLEGIKRAELFDLIDFNMPTFRVTLDYPTYEKLFIGMQCEKDMTPNSIRRNEDCYKASWVDLNYALERVIKKKYINVDALNGNSQDHQLVDNVINNKSYNVTLEEFENIVVKYSNHTLEEIFSFSYGLTPNQYPNYSEYGFELETKEASLTFELDDEVKKFDNVKFSIGGRSTKGNAKLGYNLKIKKGLYGVKQLRLRPDVVDPSFMRDKLAYDLHALAGLKTLTANYCKLYINDIYMGIYLVRDAYKSSWVEQYFGEKSTKHLYKCYDEDHNPNPFFNCLNDDDELFPKGVKDEDWEQFLKQLAEAKSREDLEKFFDVDEYIRSQVARYLFGSWDHITNKQNSYMYRSHDSQTGRDMWHYYLYDFDMNFGGKRGAFIERTFDEEIVDNTNPLYELLNLNGDSKEVRSIMEEMMRKAFNPELILPRIDRLKDFLNEYIREDRTYDENGHRPGRFDRVITRVEDNFLYEDFVDNAEFTTIKAIQHLSYADPKGGSEKSYLGLKHWMIARFKYICTTYSLDCSYAEEFLESPYAKNYVVKDSELREEKYHGCDGGDQYFCCVTANNIAYSEGSNYYLGSENGRFCHYTDFVNCWANKIGYLCCRQPDTPVSYTDKDGEWGFENDGWCGINYIQKGGIKDECPMKDSYPCCKDCNVQYTDKDGQWGIENNKWCSISVSCN